MRVLKLYEEILFLKHYFKGKWVVENVIAFYDPLITPRKLDRHHYWSNFHILKFEQGADNIQNGNTEEWAKRFGFDLSLIQGIDAKKALRNCVHPKLGFHLLNCARKEQQTAMNQW